MTAGGEQRPSRDAAWRDQSHVREESLRRFIEDFVGDIEAGDPVAANARLETTTLGEILTHGLDIHHALMNAIPGASMPPLDSPEYPGVLLVLSISRIEAAGDIVGLERQLRLVAKRLVGTPTTSIGVRARNLSQAAFALLLASEEAEGRSIAARAAELILSVNQGAAQAEIPLLAAAASDLALSYIMTEQYHPASRMWNWIRSQISDPRAPTLMQADWGLSIVGVIIGDPSRVSPSARHVLSSEVAVPHRDQGARDPWWALAQTARAWSALDNHDIDAALEITQNALREVTIPGRVSPLGSVHAVTLMAAGQPATAIEFLGRQNDADRFVASPDRAWRALIAAMAVAMAGMDATPILSSKALTTNPSMLGLAQSFAALASGDPTYLGAILRVPPQTMSPRADSLFEMVRAAVHLRLGNHAAALDALARVRTLQEGRDVVGWGLLLPDSDVQALRALAEDNARPGLARGLPQRTAVTEAAPPISLTEREREVLHLVQAGNTNAQIAAKLFISPNTVKFHVANILRRLGVGSREEAAALGIVGSSPAATARGQVG